MNALSSDGPVAESAVNAFTRSRAAFELKGVMTSLTVIRLRSRDLNLIERQLRAKVMQHPQFFQDAPVVLDVGSIEGGLAGFPLAALVRALRVCRVVPVAATNVEDAYRESTMASGLGIVSLAAARPAGDPDAGANEITRKVADPTRPEAAKATPRPEEAPAPRPAPPPPPPPPPVASGAPPAHGPARPPHADGDPHAGPLGPGGLRREERPHRARPGEPGSAAHRRRQHPHLRPAARPRAGRRAGVRRRPHLLPEARGRAHRHQRGLRHLRRHPRTTGEASRCRSIFDTASA